MYHYIYEIHPLVGSLKGKYYIGKHTTDEDPYNNKYAGSGTIITNYYNKYGKIQGITYEKIILEFNESNSINAQREFDIIGDCYNSDPRCLNCKPGGYGGMTPEIAIKISKAMEGNIPWNKGKCNVYSDDTIKRFKEIAKQRTYSWETRTKMSQSHLGKGCKSINMYDLNGTLIKTYNSIKECVEDGYCKSSVIRCLKGKFKKHKKKIFKYNN